MTHDTPWPQGARPILMTGMFDMHNFGDLMFPLIARAHLAPRGFDIRPVSATGITPDLADAPASVALPQAIGQAAAGVLIGGGYIVHGHRLDLLREYRDGDVGAWVGAGSWLGGTLLAALGDMPLAWNAPGVPHHLFGPVKTLAAPAFAAADYFNLRDEGSQRLAGTPAQIVPDTVIDLPMVWTAAELASDFRQMLQRLDLPGDGRILAVHLRGRSLGKEPLEDFAPKLQATCEQLGLTPVFVGLGSAHNDNKIARALRDAMTIPSAALDKPLALREIAALLAHAQGYIGSSLHGYVGAFAYGRPAVLVGRPAYWKFTGFIDHVDRPQDLALDWDAALAKLAAQPRAGALPARTRQALDRHWATVADTFDAGATPGRAGRMAFLRAYMQAGMAQYGASWPMQPLTTAPALAAAASGDDVRGKEPI